MGGVGNDEPPLKRVKASTRALGGHMKNSFSGHVDPPGDIKIGTLYSEAKDDTVGSNGVIRRDEFLRIITKALYSLGYEKSGAVLQEESGIPLYSPAVGHFRKQVIDGNWDGSNATLHKIGIVDEYVLKSASFLILEQKFFELLQKGKVMDALKTLRNEITPLNVNMARVHELSSCIVSTSGHCLPDLNCQSNQSSDSRSKILEELEKLIPASMIPERRLEHLVEQMLMLQRDACYFHNSLDRTLSLYVDHKCGRDRLPSQTTQILHAHQGEVWNLQFSNNGKYLASTSNDQSVIIWEVHEDGIISLKHRLTGHQKPVLMVAWSPDDSQLLSCGHEEAVRRWDVNSGECMHVYEKDSLGLTSCTWFPDGKRFCSGFTNMSICLWDINGKELECWNGQRITKTSDIAVTRDGRMIISMCKENMILLLDREAKFEKLIVEDQTIISFSLSRDDNFLLLSLKNQELHLWSISGNPRLLTKYRGHKRSRLVIRSCFGGSDQSFVASGSEDSLVYLWHRKTGNIIDVLPGHSGAVNSVSWNPANPFMLASASDDNTIRIWGLTKGFNLKQGSTSNGTLHHCNGHS